MGYRKSRLKMSSTIGQVSAKHESAVKLRITRLTQHRSYKMSAFRYKVQSGLKITRVSTFQHAMELARQWARNDRLPVIISDMRKMFNPTIVTDCNQIEEL
jgi:hypothetical protein